MTTEEALRIAKQLDELQIDPCTVGSAIADDRINETYALLQSRPNITREEFLKVMGLEEEFEENRRHDFICSKINPWGISIVKIINGGKFEKCYRLLEKNPNISKEDFLKKMKLK